VIRTLRLLVRCGSLVALLLPLALAAQPRRIVSTAPAATELLFALGLGDRVAGVTNYCRYPPEAARIAKVGSFLEPNLEVIAALRPDLVVIIKNPIALAGKLHLLRLKTLELDPHTLAGIFDSTVRLARAAGVPERGARLVQSMQAGLGEIRSRIAGRPKRGMVFIVGRTPGAIEGLVAVGKASYLSELIEIAGGENVFRGAVSAYPRISLEQMLATNPAVIVDMGDMTDTVNVTEQDKRRVVALWGRYPVLSAVQHQRVFAVASDIFVVPGPRLVEAAREFARMLHPEAGL